MYGLRRKLEHLGQTVQAQRVVRLRVCENKRTQTLLLNLSEKKRTNLAEKLLTRELGKGFLKNGGLPGEKFLELIHVDKQVPRLQTEPNVFIDTHSLPPAPAGQVTRSP